VACSGPVAGISRRTILARGNRQRGLGCFRSWYCRLVCAVSWLRIALGAMGYRQSAALTVARMVAHVRQLSSVRPHFDCREARRWRNLTRQSTRTHKCVRALRALRFLCAGYFYVMHHVLRLRLSERACSEASLAPVALQSSSPSKGCRRPQNVVVSSAASSEHIAPAAQVREGTRCRNSVALCPLQRLNAGTGHIAGSVSRAPVSSGRIFWGGRLHNKAVNTDAQGRPLAALTPILGRVLLLR
jgi:hypothetical protein